MGEEGADGGALLGGEFGGECDVDLPAGVSHVGDGQAADMRAFCDALEDASASQAASDGELAAWLTWARARADQIDPTVGTPTLTTVAFTIEPSPEDLRPHLNGWSPHRPMKE